MLDNPDFFAKVQIVVLHLISRLTLCTQAVFEQNSRPAERRCPVALASNEVVELLSDHWSIFAPGCKCYLPFPEASQLSLMIELPRFDIDGIPALLTRFLPRPRSRYSVLHKVSAYSMTLNWV